ncbi:hypothetical protein Tco_1124118, partial [Tanacetum coccineum]
HVPDFVDSCRTRKIVEDDRVSTMRKKVWNQKFWRIDNRSAQQSRVRKLQYISELERNVNSLQNAKMKAKVSVLSPRVSYLDHQRLIVNVDNSKFKFRKKRSKPVTEAITSADESGALDGSLDFHHNEKRFLGFSRGTSSLDADVHRKHIYEGHRVDSNKFQLSDPAKLYNDLRWNATRPQGFEAVMRVRCSKQEKLLEFDLLRGILGSWLKSLEARKPLALSWGRTPRLDSGVRKAFDTFCEKFHIHEKVHPVLPNQGDTMHERPTGKIGHFRINMSQLSVIGAAKVSHFEILCRVYGITPTVGLFRCFYVNSKKNGRMSFSKRSDKSPRLIFNAHDYATFVAHPSPFRKFPEEFLCLVGLSRHYTLDGETYPWFLDKDGEDMDIFAFIHTLDPTKVKVIEHERIEDEPRLLETTVCRTVPLISVAPDCAESELEASVNKLFDEGGSGNQAGQGDSAGVNEGANIQPVTEATDTVAEDVAPLQPIRQRKRKTVVVDVGKASHHPKTLREDHGTPSGVSVGSKSRSAVSRLLAEAMLNVKVRGEPIPTLPFVTSSVSATPRHSSHHSGTNAAEAEVDSLIRSSAPVMTTVTIITPTVDTAATAKEKPVEPSLFGAASSSAGGTNPTPGGFSDLTGSDFIVGGIRTVISPDTDLQKVYVPQWGVTNGSRLDDGRICCEMVDEFAPPKFFASIRGMEHDQLFIEFNVGAARQMSLSAEVRMCTEYNIREKRRLKYVVEERAELLKVREKEVEDLKAQLLLKEAKSAEAIRLRAEASKFEAIEKSLQDEVKALKERNASLEKERDALDMKVMGLEASAMGKDRELTDLNAQLTSVKSHNDSLVDQEHELEVSSSGLQEKLSNYENLTERLEEFQDAQPKIVSDKFDKLYADFVEMALHLEEKFYPHLLTTISDRRWLLTHDMKLAIIKCVNSPKYLSALGAAIGKAIKKGMQDGLAAGITHGKEGRELTDVAAHNPSAEVDYVSALQQLQDVNFSLLADLKSNKDASVETVMNILRLEDPLAEKLGLSELQPHVDQPMVPIHRSLDQVVLDAPALSLSLYVSSS